MMGLMTAVLGVAAVGVAKTLIESRRRALEQHAAEERRIAVIEHECRRIAERGGRRYA